MGFKVPSNLGHSMKINPGLIFLETELADMVLEDVTEFEITPEGRRITKLDQILLNGNNITMLVPGGEGPEV